VASRNRSLLERPAPVDQIVDGICAEFEVDRETADADVNELLASLELASLVNKETM
jgi:hypothetical protein